MRDRLETTFQRFEFPTIYGRLLWNSVIMQLEGRQGIIQAKSTDMDVRQIKVTHTDQTSSRSITIIRGNGYSGQSNRFYASYK